MTKYTIRRSKQARSPLASGPGPAWKWLYDIDRSGVEIARGISLIASAMSFARRDAMKRGIGPYYIEKAWQ